MRRTEALQGVRMIKFRIPERWLGESEQSDKCFPCLIAAQVPRSRREHVETFTTQP